jgi:hypothetical protein
VYNLISAFIGVTFVNEHQHNVHMYIASLVIPRCLKVGCVKMSENFTTKLMKAQLLFSVVFILVNSLLPSLNKSMYSNPEKVSLFALQPLAHGICQCLVIYGTFSSYGIFQRSKQMKT